MIRVTSTHAARHLSDLLDRVRYRGERFTVVRGGVEVAAIVPVTPGGTLHELRQALAGLPQPDDAFLSDIEGIQAGMRPAP